ncbi:MAG: DUF1294 domain-containing protein [Clostridia bacterium]|nr:DUF1294 domain-containing protein [Clostridia bacterium]
METILLVVGAYFLLINIAAFAAFAVDKRNAINSRRRIPNAVLLVISAAGGAVGGYIAMRTLRHKTRHPEFAYGLPIIIVVYLAILLLGLLLIGLQDTTEPEITTNSEVFANNIVLPHL